MSYTEFKNIGKGFGSETQADNGYNPKTSPPSGFKEGTFNFAYKLLDPQILFSNQKNIGKTMFGYGMNNSKDIDFSVNEQSGYITYFNKEKIYSKEPSDVKFLPQSESEATLTAFKFVEEKFALFEKNDIFFKQLIEKRNKENIEIKFNILPIPKWLIHDQTLAVKNPNTNTIDHWLVKYLIQIETPDKKKYPVLNASIEIRVGAFISILEGYEIIGYVQEWRPFYECFKVEQYLPDTGDPIEDEDHSDPHNVPHLIRETRLAYILSGQNYKQNNLLLYEIEDEGHHSSVMPASVMSIWVDFAYQDNKLYALIQGTSSNIKVHWISFTYFEVDANINLIPSLSKKEIIPQPISNYLNKNLFYVEFNAPLGNDIVLEVNDIDFNNVFIKYISLNVVILKLPPLVA